MTAPTVLTLTTRSALEGLRPEWEDLFLTSGAANPFLHPAWMLAWCDVFVRPSEIRVLTARHLGRLVGVAPFYRRHVGWGEGAGSSHLRAFGAGPHGELTEVPGVLVDPPLTRSVLRQFVRHLLDNERGWDWFELPLGHAQGWFEPEWTQASGARRSAAVIHKGTTPCVVMPLADDWSSTLAGLKRNVRQSVHRGRNRLTRAGLGWELEVVELEAFAGFVAILSRLHAARAAVPGRLHHPDRLADTRSRAFLELAGAGMLAAEHALPCILRAGQQVVAARLVLRAGRTLYLSVSGFDPDRWNEGVATTLVAETMAFGIKQGATAVNLGSGVDVSKLRWSENLERNEEFLVVAPRARSRWAFSVYWKLRRDRVRLNDG